MCYTVRVPLEIAARDVGTGFRARLARGVRVPWRRTLRAHLYEFVTKTKKLKCICGWERTLKTEDPAIIDKKFAEHIAETERQQQ